MKLLMWFFAVVAVGCLVAGGVSFWQEQQPPVKHPNFTVTPEEIAGRTVRWASMTWC